MYRASRVGRFGALGKIAARYRYDDSADGTLVAFRDATPVVAARPGLRGCRPSVSSLRRSKLGHNALVFGMKDRLRNSLLRAPYVWLIATVTLLLFLNAGLARIASPPGRGSSALAIAGSAFGVLGAACWAILQVKRRGGEVPPQNIVLSRWALAATPFLFAYCAVAAGAEQWSFSFGFVVSVILLAISARDTRREGTRQQAS